MTRDDPQDSAPRGTGLRHAGARFADAALALAKSRADLAAIEFAEERERIKRSAVMLAAGVFFLSFACFGIATFIVAFFWETHRLEAIGGVTLAFAVAGGLLFWRNQVLTREAPAPFSATVAEFEKDRDWFRGATGLHGDDR